MGRLLPPWPIRKFDIIGELGLALFINSDIETCQHTLLQPAICLPLGGQSHLNAPWLAQQPVTSRRLGWFQTNAVFLPIELLSLSRFPEQWEQGE